MELSRELYQKTFSHVKVSSELGKAVVQMAENKKKPKRFLVRRVLVAAAVLALAFTLALGANAASGGELFGNLIFMTVHFGEGEPVAYKCTKDSNGNLRLEGYKVPDGIQGQKDNCVFTYRDETTGELIQGVLEEDGSLKAIS